jgi:hypothetical protein
LIDSFHNAFPTGFYPVGVLRPNSEYFKNADASDASDASDAPDAPDADTIIIDAIDEVFDGKLLENQSRMHTIIFDNAEDDDDDHKQFIIIEDDFDPSTFNRYDTSAFQYTQ